MPADLINPPDLAEPQTYSPVAVAVAGRLVLVAGQLSEDADGRLVGGQNMAEQSRQVFGNVGRALAAAEAQPHDVVRITTYLVDLRHEDLLDIESGCASWFGWHKPPDTPVGVATQAHPGCRIEGDAVVVVAG